MNFSKKFKSTNNLKRLQENIEEKSNRATRDFLETVQEYLVEKMNEPKHGHDYGTIKRKDGSKFHYIASAPGEYPGIKNHELVDNIIVKTTSGSNQYKTIFEIGTNVPHGKFLEDKYEAEDPGGRLWLTKAIEEHEEILKMKLNEIVEHN